MAENKMVLILISGLGGLQSGPNLLTELQQAHRPHMNALIRKSVCGLLLAQGRGQTPVKKTIYTSMLGMTTKKSASTVKANFNKKYHLRTCLITADRVFQRIASALAISVVNVGVDPAAQFTAVQSNYDRYDFLILHLDAAERAAQQGEYYEKIKALEQIDVLLPEITRLGPKVLCITGDYSLPTALAKISWHPVPVMIHSPHCRYDMVQTFDEIACIQGGLGMMHSSELMPLLVANFN